MRNAVMYPIGGGAPWRPIRKVTYKDKRELRAQLTQICRTRFPAPMRIEIEVLSRTISVDGADVAKYNLVDVPTATPGERR